MPSFVFLRDLRGENRPAFSARERPDGLRDDPDPDPDSDPDPEAELCGRHVDAAAQRTSRVARSWSQHASLAALAIEHGAELCSADGDSARFPGLRWRNPLDPAAAAS